MQVHTLTITYSGLLADHGVMDAVLSEHALRGARRLLAANAYYYTQGYVPARLHSRNRYFQIVEAAPRHGSLVRDLLIGVAGSGIYDVSKVCFPEVFITAVALAGAGLLSVKKGRWIELGERVRHLLREDEPTRIEPILPMPSFDQSMHVDEENGGEAYVGTAHPSSERRGERHLITETSKALQDLINPAEQGGALRVEVRFDGDLMIRITVEQRSALPSARADLEERIAAAVVKMRGGIYR